ncbi:hypothetical protein [Streptomyces sp. NPDC054874]
MPRPIPGRRPSTVLTGDPVEEVRRLKAEEGGKGIVLTAASPWPTR